MDRKTILETIKNNKAIIVSNFDVKQIGLFGSYSRDEATETSDIDFFVEFNKVSFTNWAGLLNYLEKLFGIKVQVITKHQNLKQRFLKSIETDIIYA